jgi:hypothetical protein
MTLPLDFPETKVRRLCKVSRNILSILFMINDLLRFGCLTSSLSTFLDYKHHISIVIYLNTWEMYTVCKLSSFIL